MFRPLKDWLRAALRLSSLACRLQSRFLIILWITLILLSLKWTLFLSFSLASHVLYLVILASFYFPRASSLFGIYFLILILTLCFNPQVVSTEAGADPDVQCLAVVPAPAVGAVGGQKLIPSRLNFEVTILAFLLSSYVSSVYIFPFSSILFFFLLSGFITVLALRPFPSIFHLHPSSNCTCPCPTYSPYLPRQGNPPNVVFFFFFLNALVFFI